MKLIDMLINAFEITGGWPKGIIGVSQDRDGIIRGCVNDNGHPSIHPLYMLQLSYGLAEDYETAIITREQYEAALAASTPRPGSLLQYGAVDDEWDGVGLPPVGCKCEVAQPGQIIWDTFKVVAVQSGTVFGFFNNGASGAALAEDCWSFRPIFSEADKKRYAAANAMCKVQEFTSGEITPDGVARGEGKLWVDVYDAIAAGKIPGVKIEG